MKTRLLFVLIAVSAFVFSCTFDDSEDVLSEETTASSLIGTWDLTSFRYSEAVDANFDGDASEEFLEELPCFNIILIFNEDGTFNSTAIDIELIVDIGGATLDCLETTTLTAGTWSLDGTTLITISDGMITETPLDLDGDTLTLMGGVFGVGEVEVDEDITVTLVFDRQ
ncbi:hypothetical protein GTQ40_14275 [Flavobacteriaceae bacterium R38]|nr:hypothetical protein [Flavobacteriaceae bacterium R38]